jgi:transposase
MTIPRELEVRILRLFAAERWPVGTIAAQLDVHHEVVERVIRQANTPRAAVSRGTMIDNYVDFIRETWAKYPKLTASRLWAMCRLRGYPGAKDHFRHLVAPLRPQPVGEAYLRLRTLPGEQAQVDWAHFGKVKIGSAERPLLAFVAVLASSRAIFVRFFVGQHGENFLRGHQAAFERWGGVPRVVLYDNLKSAVLERVGDAIRFNPLLLDFAARYGYEPRPVAPGRGNEKPRVERAIRYLRSAFFVARAWRDVPDLNRQADEWCEGEALDRPWPEDPTLTVRDAFNRERPHLVALPPEPFPVDERVEARVGKTPYVRFDGNDYSVPHRFVRKTLVVLATLDVVRVLDGNDEVARHARSYDKRQTIEDARHVEALIAEKRRGREHRRLDSVTRVAPSALELLDRLAERGAMLATASRGLAALLDVHGPEALEAAIREALDQGAPHVHGVRQILDRELAARGRKPPIAVALPDHPSLRDLAVRPHDLASYDRLSNVAPTEETNRGE